MPQDNLNKRLSKAVVRPSTSEPQEIELPSKSTVEEVRKFLKLYSDELNANKELSQTSKTMYIDFATCFVRWMYGGFKPGSRGSNRRPPKRVWPGGKD